jgi:hypothetical protein
MRAFIDLSLNFAPHEKIKRITILQHCFLVYQWFIHKIYLSYASYIMKNLHQFYTVLLLCVFVLLPY